MTRDEHFLIGLSGTESDRALVRYARKLADLGLGRRFEFLHVAPADATPDAVVAARERLGETVLESFRDASDRTEIAWRVLPGIRIDVLLAEATRVDAGVILLGHRRSRSGRRSLARRLAMVGPSSVWLVPEGAPEGISRVLAPVDYSDNSADAVRRAAAVARAAGADLRVLHVSFDPSVVRYDEHDSRLRASESEHMWAFLAGIDTASLSVTTQSEEGSDTARTVLRVAGEQGADLLVMNTRGRSRAAAVLLGSVTARVMAESAVSILVVRHSGAVMGFIDVLRERARRGDEIRTN